MIHDYRLNMFYSQPYMMLDAEFQFLLQVILCVIIRLHYTVRYITFDQPIISTLTRGYSAKRPYPPCLRMADRALSAGYSQYKLYFAHPSTTIDQKWYHIRLDAVGNKAIWLKNVYSEPIVTNLTLWSGLISALSRFSCLIKFIQYTHDVIQCVFTTNKQKVF